MPFRRFFCIALTLLSLTLNSAARAENEDPIDDPDEYLAEHRPELEAKCQRFAFARMNKDMDSLKQAMRETVPGMKMTRFQRAIAADIFFGLPFTDCMDDELAKIYGRDRGTFERRVVLVRNMARENLSALLGMVLSVLRGHHLVARPDGVAPSPQQFEQAAAQLGKQLHQSRSLLLDRASVFFEENLAAGNGSFLVPLLLESPPDALVVVNFDDPERWLLHPVDQATVSWIADGASIANECALALTSKMQ